MEEIVKLDNDTKNFIETNNVFIDVKDAPNKWIERKVPGKVTYGIPNSIANVKKVKGENTILNPGKAFYDCTYTFDSKGLRTTIHTNKETLESEHAIFFGDAMAFGEGLNNNETLPSLFEKYNPGTFSHNYGFLGHGPTHMLLQISSEEFRTKFKGKKGKVFFVYRDDAIKVSVGQVPWLEGSPKYVLQNGESIHKGEYKVEDYSSEAIYLPSEYTEKDYQFTLTVFEQTRNILREISKHLQLHVIILPLSFTVHKIVKMLREKNIKCWNYYHTDLEYHTNKTARFLDGIHTPESNNVLISNLTKDIKTNTFSDTLIPTTPITNINELKEELKLHSFMLPCMVDFPIDDAGVIIAQLLKRYTGTEQYDRKELIMLSEKWHNLKISLVENKTLLNLLKAEY